MATHLTIFDNEEQYLEFLGSDKFKRPNISYLHKQDSKRRNVQYKKHFKPSKISLTFNTISAETVAFNMVPTATTELFVDDVKTPFTIPQESEKIIIVDSAATQTHIWASGISIDTENEKINWPIECTVDASLCGDIRISLGDFNLEEYYASSKGICLFLTDGNEMEILPFYYDKKIIADFEEWFQWDEATNSFKLVPDIAAMITSVWAGINIAFCFFDEIEENNVFFLDTTMLTRKSYQVTHLGTCNSWTFETLNDEVFQPNDILEYRSFTNGYDSGILSGTLTEVINNIIILDNDYKGGSISPSLTDLMNDSIGLAFGFKHADGTPYHIKHIIKTTINGEPVILKGAGKHTINLALKGNTIPTFNGLSTTLTKCEISNAKHIDDNVFEYCSNLASISLPSTLKTIGSKAFIWCDKLSSISLPKSITSIGSSAFESCKGLTSISIPDSVTAIQPHTFYNCTKLSSVKLGKNVISIGNDAFKSCSNLTSINFPEPLKTIGEFAFESCSLREIILKRNLKSIGNNAFSNCSKLSKITSHATIAPSIGKNTFYDIGNFGRLITPNGSDYSLWLSNNAYYLGYYGWNSEPPIIKCTYNVTDTSVATNLIYSYSNVSSISIDGQELNSVVDSYVFSEVGKYSVEFTLNNRYVSNKQFSGCTDLISIEISDLVTSIGDSAFTNCYGLNSIEIPESVTSIGGHAFANCSGLTSIVIPSSVTSIKQNTFINNYSLSTIEIPDTVTSIGVSAFTNCHSLQSVVIPDSVTSVGNYAFAYCYNLKTANLGNGLTSIKPYTFYCCGSLETIDIPNTINSIGNNAFYCCSGLTSVTLTNGLESIGNYAFQCCSGLTSIVIPDSVSAVGYQSFEYCRDLASVTIGSGITDIKNRTFFKTGLESVNIPDSVTKIGELAFAYCEKLKTVHIADSVTQMDNDVFDSCKKLTSVRLSNSLSAISYNTFERCYSLNSITIPDSVKTIGNYAFQYCSGLTSVTIGSGITSIGTDAFYNCSQLSSITITATVAPSIYNDTFYGVGSYGILSFPEGSDYSTWLQTSKYYLGYYKWVGQEIS